MKNLNNGLHPHGLMVTTYVPQNEKLNTIKHMQVYLALHLHVHLVIYTCKFTLLFIHTITILSIFLTPPLIKFIQIKL